ncbi:hypothetical protein BDR22DRAFT_915074 [Usnea florida]
MFLTLHIKKPTGSLNTKSFGTKISAAVVLAESTRTFTEVADIKCLCDRSLSRFTKYTGYMEVESIMDCTKTDNALASRLSHVYHNGLNIGHTDFPLLQLPPELRLLVYGPLIAAGDLSIMRTNKLIHDEAVNLLKTHAVLRMFLRYPDRTSSALVPLTATVSLEGSLTVYASPVIQRIELHLNQVTSPFTTFDAYMKSLFRFDAYVDLIKSFGGRDVARQSCIIYLELGTTDATPGKWSFSQEKSWKAIANLTGFKTLALKISRKRDPAYEDAKLRSVRPPVNRMSLYGTIYDYSTLGTIMSTTLGPATVCTSPTGTFLEFHPSDFKK